MVFSATIALAVALLLGWLVGRRITGPLRHVSAAVADLERGDYSRRINVDSEDGRQTFAIYHLSPEHSADDVEQAMAILKEIAGNDPDTKDRVYTGFIRITEYSREVMLLYWVLDEASNVTTRTRINLEILRRFATADIRLVESTRVHAKVLELED